jgi:hypothetical protein
MDCRTFRNKLEDYLEGSLDFAGRFGMERHAQQCFTCGKTVADAQELNRMTRELKRVTAPSDFEAAVMRRIQSENNRNRFLRSFQFWIWSLDWPSRRALLAGAVGVAVVTLGIFVAYRANIRHDNSVNSNSPANPLQESNPSAGLTSADMSPLPEQATANPASVPGGRFKPVYADLPVDNVGAEDSDYVECLIPGPGDRMMVVRLPKTIRMRYIQPSEQYFIRSVSH